MDSTNFLPILGRWMMTFISALFALVQPALPYFLICLGFVFLDCYSAWRLARRVKAKYPGRASGKFLSEKMGHVFRTLSEICLVLVLVHLAQVYIAGDLPFNITKVVAGAICGWQFWSYLENSSSCNGAKWAQVARKIFIDKTERHFDILLNELKSDENTDR